MQRLLVFLLILAVLAVVLICILPDDGGVADGTMNFLSWLREILYKISGPADANHNLISEPDGQ